MRKPALILFLLLFLLLPGRSKANTTFTPIKVLGNIHLSISGEGHSGPPMEEYMFCYLVQNVLNVFGDTTPIYIQFGEYNFIEQNRTYRELNWSIGYTDSVSMFNNFHTFVGERGKNSKRGLQILYNARAFDMRTFLELVYYGLSHRNEIERAQREFNVTKDTTKHYIIHVRNTDINDPLNDTTLQYPPVKFTAVPDTALLANIRTCQAPVDSILQKKVYYFEFETEDINSSSIHYYFQNNQYHFYPRQKLNLFNDFEKANTWPAFCRIIKKHSEYLDSDRVSQSSLLVLDGFAGIVPFKNTCLVFESDSTFYDMCSLKNKIAGPFIIHNLGNFDILSWGGDDDKQHRNEHNIRFDVILKPKGYGHHRLRVNYNSETGQVKTNFSALMTEIEEENKRDIEWLKKMNK